MLILLERKKMMIIFILLKDLLENKSKKKDLILLLPQIPFFFINDIIPILLFYEYFCVSVFDVGFSTPLLLFPIMLNVEFNFSVEKSEKY
jgi:hypothetical protein